MTTAAKNLAAALALADAGFRAFPARAIYNPATQRWNKPPCIQNWQSLATDDPSQIKLWWRQYPDAIPAICCEQFIVIDADRHPDSHDGVMVLGRLVRLFEKWPDHPVVRTPSNGEHHYFSQAMQKTGEIGESRNGKGCGRDSRWEASARKDDGRGSRYGVRRRYPEWQDPTRRVLLRLVVRIISRFLASGG